MSDALPRRLRSYRFERILGRGGMGIVHLAYDQRLRRHVAIKRVLSDGLSEVPDSRRRERLRREARTAAQLTHPAIVQIFDLIEADDGDWIVMEWVEGTLLAESARSGPLAFDRVLAIGRQIAAGLIAAHAHGIVHRDLKTENIIVVPDGRIKILDFGLAKQVHVGREVNDPEGIADVASRDLTVSGQVIGTGRAMSPEQVRGLEVGPRSDLFSFGVLLYEISTGVSPFRSASFFDTLTRVATHQQAPASSLVADLPAAFSELLDRLLAKAPELRPINAGAVADELARLAGERVEVIAQELGQVSPAISEPWRSPDDETLTDDSSAAFSLFGSTGLRKRRLAGGVAASILLATLIFGVSKILFRASDAADAGMTESVVAGAALLTASRQELYEEGMHAVRRPDDPKNVDRAIEIFQRMLELDGESAAAHAGLARAYWEKARGAATSGDPVYLKQAVAVSQEAVRLNPYLADARVSLGLALMLEGQRHAAQAELEAALELDPANADAHFGLGKLTISGGSRAAAAKHYQRAFELQPAALYANSLGAVLYSEGRYDDAESYFLASLELAPDNVHTLRNLGSLYYARGQTDEAASRFQEALRVRPDASLYSNLGTLFFDRGLYPRAAAAYEDALAMPGSSTKWIFWLHLADAYRQMPGKQEAAKRNYRQAIRLLDQELEAAPGDIRHMSRRAIALARSGRVDEAREEVERMLEAGMVKDVYSLLRLAITDELCGERGRALQTLETALRSGLEPSEVRREPDLLHLRAEVQFQDLLMRLEDESLSG